MKTIQEPPIGIILTMPKQWFDETGHTPDTCLDAMMKCMNEEEETWLFLKHNLPVLDFLYVYVVFDKKVQLRCNLSHLERGKSYGWADTPDGKERLFFNKNWIVLCGPAVKAPYEIAMQGFQGFRYVYNEIF